MANFILAGLFTEGTTDISFLASVIERTLEEVVFYCKGEFETRLEIINIDKKGLSFDKQVLNASQQGLEKFSITLLFVHTDADASTDTNIFNSKIIPAQSLLDSEQDNIVCKKMVAIVPIQMTESWMIADKTLLKEEIGIDKSDADLGIHKNPEEIWNPKSVIEDIIRQSKAEQTKRKRRKGLNISELYQIIGRKIELTEVEKLSSYLKFKKSLIEKLTELNFYQS